MPDAIRSKQLEDVRVEDSAGKWTLEILAGRAARSESGALYELCEKIVKNVLFRLTHIIGNRTDAEDVTQEVLIRVCQKIRDLRDPKAFGVWLGKIIANEAKRYMAEKARHGVVLNIDDYLENIMEEKDDFLPQKCAGNEECRKSVMKIIAGLPIRQREAVIFHYYDGLSVTETAGAMGVPKQDVSRYIALAREKIKIELEKQQLTGRNIGMIAALPVGALLTDVLQRESESILLSGEAWTQQALARCAEYISSIPAGAASKDAFGWLMGAVAAVVTVATVFVGISLGGAPAQVLSEIVQDEIAIAGTITFSGGVDNGGNTVYVNPEHAEPALDSTGGTVAMLHWWITPATDDDILCEGEGDTLDDTLIWMQENGMEGGYMLFFRLEDEAGAVHRMGRSFYIMII